MPTKFNDSTVKKEMTLWGAIVGHYLHPCKAFDRFYIISCCQNCGNWAVIVYWYTKRKNTHFSFNLWAEKRENVIPTGETLINYILYTLDSFVFMGHYIRVLWIHLFLWATIYVYCGFICFYGSLYTCTADSFVFMGHYIRVLWIHWFLWVTIPVWWIRLFLWVTNNSDTGYMW